MLIGHYAPALLAASGGKIKLWQGFLAVQLVDIAWAGFILIGLEKTRIVEGFTGNNPLDLYHVPYTHSLGMNAVWAIVAAFLFFLIFRKQAKVGAILFGLLVLSHWFLDLLVHGPDLTLWFGTQKFGVGLWNSPILANVVEIGLFLAGTVWFLAKTEARHKIGKLYPIGFVAVMILMLAISQTMPLPDTLLAMSVPLVVSYFFMMVLAAILDKTRRVRPKS